MIYVHPGRLYHQARVVIDQGRGGYHVARIAFGYGGDVEPSVVIDALEAENVKPGVMVHLNRGLNHKPRLVIDQGGVINREADIAVRDIPGNRVIDLEIELE